MKWEMVSFSDVLDIKNGRDHKKVSSQGGIYPIYGSGGIMGYANQYLCDENAVIIGRKGSINNPLFVSTKFWNVDTAFALCPKTVLDPKFFYYFCLTYNFEKHNKATTLPSLTKTDLLEIQIPLPPLATQKRIAAILDAADALRRKDQALLQKYDELAQAIFVDMFGDPVKNEKGWEVCKLGESLEFLTSGSRGWAKYYSDEGDIFLRINNVGRNRLKLEDLVFVQAPDNAEATRTRVKEGDILFSITADLGRTCVIPKNFPKAYINQHLSIIRLKRNFDPYFVSQVLASDSSEQQISVFNKGGVKAGLNFDDVRSLHFINPPFDLQKKFSATIEFTTRIKEKIDTNAKASQTLFQSLLQKAFNAELVP